MKTQASVVEARSHRCFILSYRAKASAIIPAVLSLALIVTACNRPSSTAPPTANSTASGNVLSKNVQVSGQVFIVTKSGESIKLGLVHVGIDDLDGAELQRKSICDLMTQKLSDAKAKIDASQITFQEVQNKYNKLLPDYTSAKQLLDQATSQDGVSVIGNTVYGVNSIQAAEIVKRNAAAAAIGSQLASLRVEVVNKFSDLRVLIMEQHNDVQSCLETYFDTAGAIASTKTDADGRFSLSVPEGKSYVLVAESQRTIGDDTEKYYWILPVDLTKADDGLSVLLSNDNQLDDPVTSLKVDSSLIFATIDDLPLDMYGDDIIKEPTSYTFQDNMGGAVTPYGSGGDTAGTPVGDSSMTSSETGGSTSATETVTPADSIPAWTPPNSIPTKDNWTWTIADKVYQNVVITSVDPNDNTISITHSGGVAHLPVATLPADVQTLLNYNGPSAAGNSTPNSTNTSADTPPSVPSVPSKPFSPGSIDDPVR